MTLRHRVIAVALAALAIIAVLGAQLVLRYADTQRSVSEVVDTLAPASTAVADLNEDVNNMERRLRIYVSSDSMGMGLLYRAAVVSAQSNLEELRTLLEGREPDSTLVEDVDSDLAAWLATVGDPVTSAMDDGERKVAQGILDSPQSQSAYVQLTSDTFRLSTLLTRQQKETLDDLAAAATPAGMDPRSGPGRAAPAAAGHLRRGPSARAQARSLPLREQLPGGGHTRPPRRRDRARSVRRSCATSVRTPRPCAARWSTRSTRPPPPGRPSSRRARSSRRSAGSWPPARRPPRWA